MLPAASLAAALLALTPRAHYELAVRSEARAAVDSSAQASSVLDLSPRGTLGLQLDALRLTGSYQARLALYELTNPRTPELLHTGALTAELAVGEGKVLFARQELTYGLREFTLLSAAPASPGDPGGGPGQAPTAGAPLPDVGAPLDGLQLRGSAPYFASNSSAGLALAFGRLWFLMASGGYEISGGADESVRDLLPLQQGPHFEGLLSYLVTDRDTVGSGVTARDSRFSNGRRASVLVVDARWARQLLRPLSGELRVGLSGFRAVREDGVVETAGLPVAGAALNYQTGLFSNPLHLHGEVQLAPYVDPFGGRVYHRVEAALGASWAYQRLTVNARAAGSLAVTGWERRGTTVLTGDLGAAYLFSRRFQLEAGMRAGWQSGLELAGAPFAWGGYVALAFNENGAL